MKALGRVEHRVEVLRVAEDAREDECDLVAPDVVDARIAQSMEKGRINAVVEQDHLAPTRKFLDVRLEAFGLRGNTVSLAIKELRHLLAEPQHRSAADDPKGPSGFRPEVGHIEH